MIRLSNDMVSDYCMRAAEAMCAAAKTAPKAKGVDVLDACVITGNDLDALARTMDTLADKLNYAFFKRDADCVRKSGAVVIIGARKTQRGLGKGCSLCGFDGCASAKASGATCVYDPMDLGIALGSAVSIAADMRVDTRIMFSVGKAALEMGCLSNCDMAMAIPVSVSAKSPFFDR